MGSYRRFTSSKDMAEVVGQACDLGYVPEKTSNGHIKFTHPLLRQPVFAPSSPSDIRSARNTAALLRRKLRQARANSR